MSSAAHLPEPATGGAEERLRPPADGWPVRVGASTVAGRGLFTTRPVAEGEVLEVAALTLVADEHLAHLDDAGLSYFDVAGDGGLPGGALAFVNHDYEPNAVYEVDVEAAVVTLTARRPLARGEEVTVNYNGDPDDTGPLWFEVG